MKVDQKKISLSPAGRSVFHLCCQKLSRGKDETHCSAQCSCLVNRLLPVGLPNCNMSETTNTDVTYVCVASKSPAFFSACLLSIDCVLGRNDVILKMCLKFVSKVYMLTYIDCTYVFLLQLLYQYLPTLNLSSPTVILIITSLYH